MNDQLIEELLNDSESSTLDLKRDPYPFVRASDDEKGELLKDLLAFANAWRSRAAYILTGVEEVKDGPNMVVGISEHFDEADFQKFVNSKTNRPVEFSYQEYQYEGKHIGIFTIPVQERPLYLKKDFGRLSKNIVFVRRGSSTGIATLDEVYRMGVAAGATPETPTLQLQFGTPEDLAEPGPAITVVCKLLQLADEWNNIPDYPAGRGGWSYAGMNNRNYYRELAEYIFLTTLHQPVGFALRNTGSTLLTNAQLEFVVPRDKGLSIELEHTLPALPSTSGYSMPPGILGIARPDRPVLTKRADGWHVTLLMGNVQPHAVKYSDPVYIGSATMRTIAIDAVVYADNLPTPVHTMLTVECQVVTDKLTIDQLRSYKASAG